MAQSEKPAVVVFSSLFPHPGRPGGGLFIRERLFRVGKHLPITVVSPQPWFPFQGVIRYLRPHFRPAAPAFLEQDGIAVYYPRFLSFPGLFKTWDGASMAFSCKRLLKRLQREKRLDLLDAHFAYPDGYAATRLAKQLDVPVSITLRGTETRLAKDKKISPLQRRALTQATQIIAVADSLRRLAVAEGVPETGALTVGNGVDTERFHPLDKAEQRQSLSIPADAEVMISVGGLCARKGFHRVIDCLPDLLKTHPKLHYLIIGGPSPEGDLTQQLKNQVAQLGLEQQVRFLGAWHPDDLRKALSASDIFVLATANEGWANVFLEAMACGLPVVTTDVGGNAEVVCRKEFGAIVPFGDQAALSLTLEHALNKDWNRAGIIAYAKQNSWDSRVKILLALFKRLSEAHRKI
jgi:glycosyltransferase involved in cell wall biosynthesis